jgi:hypothetical protein
MPHTRRRCQAGSAGDGRGMLEANAGGRLIILALLVLTFLIPALWSSSPVNLICFTGRIILGIGCFIYLKWQRVF